MAYVGANPNEWGPHSLSVTWKAARELIKAGEAAADGQILNRATYPDAWSQIEALVGTSIVTDDATWLADPAQRGKFSTGDGSTTFRLPDFNGKTSGSYGAVYLTGDGLKSAGEAGLIRQDELQDHWHGIVTANSGGTGGKRSPANYPTSNNGIHHTTTIGKSDDVGVSYVEGARTNTYTHGTDVSGVWVIHLFGTMVNVGSADAAQLASDYANLTGRVDNKLDASDALGMEQEWVTMTGQRSLDVTYTNTTGRPIYVKIITENKTTGVAQLQFRCNGGIIDFYNAAGTSLAGGTVMTVSGVIPPGATYTCNGVTTGLGRWRELR